MKTKIIATIGPKSEDRETLSKLIEAGLDIARMNFSHCTYEEYKKRAEIIREESARLGKKVAILQDLQGPRIRVGEMPVDGLRLKRGDLVIFTVKGEEDGKIFIDEPSIVDSIEIGHPLFLTNGDMELVVREKSGQDFKAEVIRGGILFSKKGVNVPETRLSFNGLTEKDLRDLDFALSEGVDYVAVSFVQSAEDIRKVNEIVAGRARVMAKIESSQALRDIDNIIRESDSIMIARGDLGVEVPMEKVPFIQKNLIRQAHWHNKGAIVATQMLLSMVRNNKPTRAEVSDVANAVLDGADAVMLSDESAGGTYPLESVETMNKIVAETERLFHETGNLL